MLTTLNCSSTTNMKCLKLQSQKQYIPPLNECYKILAMEQ